MSGLARHARTAEELADPAPVGVSDPQHCSETGGVSRDVSGSDLKPSFQVAFVLFYVF